MTPQEFKAWFEGFTEAFDRIPSKAQWARIKERVAEIDGKPVTERVYVERYWPTVYPHYQRWYTTYTSAVGSVVQGGNTALLSSTNSAQAVAGSKFNATASMYDLGRADAAALAGA